jgi:bifunctional polynucleotide phosphatase/kinase
MSSPGKENLKRQGEPISPPPLKRKAPTPTSGGPPLKSATTKAAVKSFFTPTSKKEPEKISWKTVNETLLVARYPRDAVDVWRANREKKGETEPVKVAAFDFDSTIIETVSGNRFAKDSNDWKWWRPEVPAALRKLHSDGYVLVLSARLYFHVFLFSF